MSNHCDQRVLILAMPRSGTTIIQKQIATFLCIPNLVEPDLDFDFSTELGRNQWHEWLQNYKRGTIKILTSCLYHVDFVQVLNLVKFDHYVLVERQDLVSCCISGWYAGDTTRYHWTPEQDAKLEQFYCPIDWVHSWVKQYDQLHHCEQQVIDQGVPVTKICYETFMQDQAQMVMGHEIRSGIQVQTEHENKYLDYQQLCYNYQTVKDIIEAHTHAKRL